MKEKEKFSIRKRTKSFRYAYNGLKILYQDEHNSRIHLAVAAAAGLLSFFLDISTLEWIAVIFVTGFVFAMEIINSAIENMADFVSPEKHDAIKKIKDLSAAAVLVSALT